MEQDLPRREKKVALAIWVCAIMSTLAMILLVLLSDTEISMAHLRVPTALANQQPMK
jgi:hypothetical protein